MKKRNDLMEKLAEDSLHKINGFAKPDNPKYKDLVKQLILQGMVKLLEPQCFVRVRKIDVDFVKTLFKDLQQEYSQIMKRETGEDYNCTLEIDEKIYLDNPCGGVLLLNSNRKITLINDMDTRLRLTFEQRIPVVKNMLFHKTK